MAIKEMNRTGVPAAIKIAQGILETNAGQRIWYLAPTIILESNANQAGPERKYIMMMTHRVNVSENIQVLKILILIILII